jgi:hypothetical protein
MSPHHWGQPSSRDTLVFGTFHTRSNVTYYRYLFKWDMDICFLSTHCNTDPRADTSCLCDTERTILTQSYPHQSGTLGTSRIQKVCITTDSLWSRGHHGTLDTDQVANGSYDRSTWLGNIVCEVVWKDYITLGLHVLGVGGMGLLTGERDGEREGEHLIVVLHKLCWTCLRFFHKHHKVSPYNL